jgi:hypothetical protein
MRRVAASGAPVHRAVAVLALVLGVALIVLSLSLSLFERTAGAERTTDRFRALMSPAGLVDLRNDFETVRSAGLQFRDRTIPDFARALGLSPPEMDRFVRTNFPAVHAGVASFPATFAFVDPNIDRLEVRSDEFSNLDAIPTDWLPLHAAAWLLFGLGVALVAVGAFGLFRPGRVTTGLCAALGVVMVVLPLALGIPGKAEDARDVGDIAKGGLSQAGATQADQINDGLEAMVGEIRTKMLPALSTRLNVTPEQLNRQLARDYPAVAKFLGMFDQLLPEARGLAARQQASVDDFAKADKTPIKAIPWLLIVPGAVLALVAVIALVAGTRRSGPAN